MPNENNEKFGLVDKDTLKIKSGINFKLTLKK